ncbi:MAG: class I SAM-dependent methyltransferase, partial [Nitriliruptorales bacterium]
MGRETVRLTKEQETLLATLYGRALDCRAAQPILGDEAAVEALGRLDYDFSKLKMSGNDAVSVAIRAKYLDRIAMEDLANLSEANVLHLGCGLDSRVLRLDPSAKVGWYDVDYPEVIELRRRVYGEYAHRKSYRMIGSSVVEPGWLDEVDADRPVVVVAEGLVQYLNKDDLVALLERITDRFPTGRIGFDAWNSLAARLAPLQRQLRAIGGKTAGWGIDDPRELAHLVPRLGFDSEIIFTEIPELDRLTWPYRVLIGLM